MSLGRFVIVVLFEKFLLFFKGLFFKYFKLGISVVKGYVVIFGFVIVIVVSSDDFLVFGSFCSL